MELKQAVRWRFIGILKSGKEVELFPDLPFISSDSEAVKREAVRRSREYDRIEWVMNVKMIRY